MSRRRLALLVAALALASLLLFAPVGSWIRAWLDWIAGLGPVAPVAYVVLYVIATVLLLPGSPLTIGAGAAFGVLGGSAVVLVGATLGATAAWLLARTLLRDRVRAWVQGHPRLAAVDREIGRNAAWTAFLLRLSPAIPFNLLNYALGVTPIRLPQFLFACLAMIPGIVLYTWIGAAAGASAMEGHQRGPLEWTLLGLGILATLYVTVRLGRAATRKLGEAAPAEEESP